MASAVRSRRGWPTYTQQLAVLQVRQGQFQSHRHQPLRKKHKTPTRFADRLLLLSTFSHQLTATIQSVVTRQESSNTLQFLTRGPTRPAGQTKIHNNDKKHLLGSLPHQKRQGTSTRTAAPRPQRVHPRLQRAQRPTRHRLPPDNRWSVAGKQKLENAKFQDKKIVE